MGMVRLSGKLPLRHILKFHWAQSASGHTSVAFNIFLLSVKPSIGLKLAHFARFLPDIKKLELGLELFSGRARAQVLEKA